MENILVVIRDEIRENRKVLEEIRDILKHQINYREMQKPAPTSRTTNGQEMQAHKPVPTPGTTNGQTR